MAEECRMAQVLLDGWKDFSLSAERFQQITEDFAAAMAVHFGLDHQTDALAVFTALRLARNQFA